MHEEDPGAGAEEEDDEEGDEEGGEAGDGHLGRWLGGDGVVGFGGVGCLAGDVGMMAQREWMLMPCLWSRGDGDVGRVDEERAEMREWR